MHYLSHVFAFLIFLVIGLNIGKRTFNYTNRFFDYALVILVILSFWIGVNSYLFKIFDFEVIASTVLPAMFLGIVIRRFNKKYKLIQKFN